MKVEEFVEICGALCLKRNDASFHITILVIESQEKLQYSNERSPQGTLVGYQKSGIRNPTGSAPPSILEQSVRIFPTTRRNWVCS